MYGNGIFMNELVICVINELVIRRSELIMCSVRRVMGAIDFGTV